VITGVWSLSSSREALKWGRWLLLLILITWAFKKCRDLNLNLPNLEQSWFYPCFLILGGFLAHGVQAGMTWLIARFCQVKIPFSKCLSLNVMGGLWGLLLPMGSVGYKALALKKDHGLSMSSYGSFYGLATMANIWASLMLLNFFGVFADFVFGPAIKFFIFTGPIWVFLALKFISRWPMLNKWTGQPLTFRRYLVCFLSLVVIQLLGAMVYLGIYLGALSWMSVNLPFGPVFVVVVLQSVLFLAPIVPGNAVVLESAGMWWLAKFGVEPSVGVAAILIMRFSVLGTLVMLSPWAMWRLSSEKNESQRAELL
jgi:hypothetical protein